MILSGVVLAGGRSSRMGCDKALVEVGGQSLVHRQVDLLRQAGCTEKFISGRAGVDYPVHGARVLLDPTPGLGPLAGIHAALASMAGTHLLVVAVDLPLIQPRHLAMLSAACGDASGAVFGDAAGLEPLVAIYPRVLAVAAGVALELGNRSVQAFCRNAIQAGLLRTIAVPAGDSGSFLNCNQPEDMESIRKT